MNLTLEFFAIASVDGGFRDGLGIFRGHFILQVLPVEDGTDALDQMQRIAVRRARGRLGGLYSYPLDHTAQPRASA